MKTIGLIGGMSWESSLVYYELINKKVQEVLGGFHSCKNIMISVNFAEVEKLQHEGNWEALNTLMADAAKNLELAGADLVVLCTNTMHLCSEAILKNISIPFLHIAEATGQEINKKKLSKVALLGTKFTMEKEFYKELLTNNFGIEVLIPTKKERQLVHNIIYNELVQGKINNSSKEVYKNIIHNLEKRGSQGVILGCTEIPLLIKEKDVTIPIFNTTKIHAEKAVEWALKE
ncbi:MAG: aspartate/glutamate racemase family protein [Lutibacter sp.]|uniref:aspartate/glutamate racemase family protein n=1 Tax=Lutibacter sp. TaxID=1925666 RepID=UPI0017A6D12E|nr:aspartate/glutamate racemase family protein [Lutibacter sp.]MBT8316121.1 aspartate/glutamate racemase family protein [Lutibacter sp.]NNJ56981.1 aspartate/glutamate racemase family protein [Lutibacter sp.]